MDERRADAPPPDEAVFAPARIPRSPTPIAALGVALALGGLALAGVLDGLRASAPAAVEQPVERRMIDVPANRAIPPSVSRLSSPAAPLLALEATTSAGIVLVNGDVYTRDAVVVVVSIADAAEDVLAIRSVEMPGGSTAFRTAANDRFFEVFEVEAWPARQAAWVTADAYDRLGLIIASAQAALAGPPVETAASDPTSTSPPLIGRGWPPAHLASEALGPVRIDRPAGGAGAVTDRFIAVRGELRVHAAAVRVSLQTSERVTLDSTVVDTSNVDGGIRPLHAPGIDVQLTLPTPRPTGERLWIVVTAYDGAGTPLGAVRRLVTIGEVADG